MRFHRAVLLAGILGLGLVSYAGSQGINNPFSPPATACTNQFVRSLAAVTGVGSCATVGTNDLASSLSLPTPTFTATAGTLTRIASFLTTGMSNDQKNYFALGTAETNNNAFYVVYNHNSTAGSRLLCFQGIESGACGASSLILNASGIVTLATANYNTCTGLTTSSGVLTCTVSSARFKISTELLAWDDEQIKRLLALTPASFTYKDPTRHGSGEHLGLYAEDVCKVDERLCVRDSDGQVTSYEDRGVMALLITALKRQQAQIDELKRRLN